MRFKNSSYFFLVAIRKILFYKRGIKDKNIKRNISFKVQHAQEIISYYFIQHRWASCFDGIFMLRS